jgi:adenine-specific DNA-methyltransferase
VPIQPANRNYLGNKQKLTKQLSPIIEERLGKFGTLFDPFAGTGSIPYALATPKRKIVLVEQLKSSHLPLQMFFKVPPQFLQVDAMHHVDCLNSAIEKETPDTSDYRGYVAENWGDKYFSIENAMKIDLARAYIEDIRNRWVKDYCLTSLIYAADKVSWTFGHYDAFKKQEKTKNQSRLKLEYLDLSKSMCPDNVILRGDALITMQINSNTCKSDVCFLDPPYNARQYGANYHLLENLVEWEHPECHGFTAKYKDYPRSMWSTKIAPQVFADFVEICPSKHIIMTYNNQEGNLITANQIVEAFEKKGKLEIACFDKQIITTGKSDPSDNKEIVYICETR